jgi:hypothetical protein
MNRKRIYRGLACLVAGAAFLASPVKGEAPAMPTAAPLPALEPAALARLKAMGDLLKGAGAFTFTAKTVREQRGEGGQMLDFFSASKVAVTRPNRVRVDTVGDLHNASLWYDGKTVTIFSSKSTFYAQAAAPAAIDEAVQMLVDRFEAPLPVAGFLLKDPYARMIDGVKSAFEFGVVKIDGVSCHHLVLSEEAADWQIWIEDGPRPLPRRLAVIYKKLEGAPRVVSALSDWNLSPAIPPGDFAFQAPAGAKKVDWKTVEK